MPRSRSQRPLKDLADQLSNEQEFGASKPSVQKKLLEDLRFYLEHNSHDVGEAFKKSLELPEDFDEITQSEADRRWKGVKERQPSYKPLPAKVLFALIEYDEQWRANPVIQCTIEMWQRSLRAAPSEHPSLREHLKRIDENLIPIEVRGAGNFGPPVENTLEQYEYWYEKFRDLKERYDALPGRAINPKIRSGVLLDKLLTDTEWQHFLYCLLRPNASAEWTPLTADERAKALSFLKEWLPERGKSPYTLACQRVSEMSGLKVSRVQDIVKRRKKRR